MEKDLKKLIQLIEDLGFDEQRMSLGGQETYEQILRTLNRFIRKWNAAKERAYAESDKERGGSTSTK